MEPWKWSRPRPAASGGKGSPGYLMLTAATLDGRAMPFTVCSLLKHEMRKQGCWRDGR